MFRVLLNDSVEKNLIQFNVIDVCESIFDSV